ncbi:hypothetical protein FHX48_001391 [Microbacterium halimionae]|uniref:Cell division protein FtsL n=1 Tax=Microbacterium halimionae TaxID=1526413 RepID=A0A7W3JP58_9MICO|nr:hypothetical protein [Microbacterium halimionae]MBA8816318.1 hypothetical protein [Microbacterium halimionae]NII96521.1 hypothetical protein [Microbacterium halimionae]
MSTAMTSITTPVEFEQFEHEFPQRRLEVVTAPHRRRRPRLLYGIVAVAGAVAIAGAQMTLSILTTQTTYQLSSLTQQERDLTYQKQMVYDDVAGLSSPQYLAANASALGMVINESPSYLRLSDGAILGMQQASVSSSSVDALSRASVPNALITDTPLVTSPDATITGPPAATIEEESGSASDSAASDSAASDSAASDSATPPALTDGLPTPQTH